jgi:two-component system, sensor histidine kinase and response regulator
MIDPLPKPSPSALVLVVDDEVKNIQVVGSLLLRHGHEVIASTSGADALDKLETAHPDLILLDVMMPGMTGFELCRRLSENPATRDIPVLFLSAAADKNFVVEALAAGAVDYITKPFHGPELISRVELHANRRKTLLQLAKVIQEKNQLLEVVAHDLKNPLSGIQFAASMLSENADLTEKSRVELIKSIQESADRAFEIVSGLLDTRGLEDVKANITKTPINLNEHAVKAVRNFDHHCRRKDITLDFESDVDSVLVLGEGRLLVCCIENLVSNAIKFSPPGSKVSVGISRDSEMGVFRIEDEGPAILEEEVDRLFGKFTRLSARPTGGETSTGLGLHIVHELVTVMGGAVTYEKRETGGARFLIELPLAEASAEVARSV